MSEAIPRLGAYFRKPFSRLSANQIQIVDKLITRILVKAYIFHLIAAEIRLDLDNIKTAQDVFEAWVIRMYSSAGDVISNYPPQTVELLTGLLGLVLSDDLEELKSTFGSMNIKPGFFQKTEVLDQILLAYINADFCCN